MAVSATTLNSAISGDGSVILSWDSVVAATSYIVKYGTATGVYTTEVNVGNVITYEVTGLTNGTTYYFSVEATDLKLFLEFEGTDESTTFTDTAGNHTVTANGNVQIDTDQAKNGSSSGLFQGTADYLTIPSSPDFNYRLGGNDIVIEFYVRFNVLPSSSAQYIMNQGGNNASSYSQNFWTVEDFGKTFILFTTKELGSEQVSFGELLVVDTWYKIKVNIIGATMNMYLDDVLKDTTSVDRGNISDTTGDTLIIGALSPGTQGEFAGWLDDLKIYVPGSNSNELSASYTAQRDGYCPYVESGEVRKMVDTISGLDHLEGLAIQVQMDGVLPTDSDGELVTNSFTVTSGEITLPKKAAVVHAGLGYEGTLQLLKSGDGSREGTGQSKMRRIYLVATRFFKSLGLKVGLDADNLSPMFTETPSLPLFTGDKKKLPITRWVDNAELMFKMEDPLPCFMLSTIVKSEVEEK